MNHAAPAQESAPRFIYALVDSENREAIPADLERVPLVPRELEDNADMLPTLVTIGLLTAKELNELLQEDRLHYKEWHPAPYRVVIDTHEDPYTVQNHLSQIQLIEGPEGQRAWLRLHDSRVWIQLWRILPTEAMSQLYGPILRWSFHINNQWLTKSKPVPTGHAPSTRLQLDAEQWAAMERIGVINRALKKLKITAFKDIVELSPELDSLVQRGQQRHALSSTSDLTSYVCYGYRVGTRFDEHRLARQAIEEIKRASQRPDAEPGLNIIDALNELSDQDWQIIQHDLSNAHFGY